MRSAYLLVCWVLLGCLTTVALDPSRKVVFIRDGNVYRGDAAGHVRQLTSDGVPKWALVWSRDGEKLAFMREARDSLGNLVVMTDSGEEVAVIQVQPVGSGPLLRFVETVQWVTPTRVAIGGSVNPSTTALLIMDIETGKQVGEVDSDVGDPVFSPDGGHDASLSGSPHFTPEEFAEPELDIDGKRVYPAQHVKVNFLTEPIWSPDGKKLTVLAADEKSKTYSVITWRADGPLLTIPIPASWDDLKADMFWSDGTLMLSMQPCTWRPVNATTLAPDCTAVGRAWKVTDDSKTLVEIPPRAATRPNAKESPDEQSMLSLVRQAGGSSADVWCKSCALATRPRAATANGQ